MNDSLTLSRLRMPARLRLSGVALQAWKRPVYVDCVDIKLLCSRRPVSLAAQCCIAALYRGRIKCGGMLTGSGGR